MKRPQFDVTSTRNPTPAAGSPVPETRFRLALVGLALVLATVAAYAPALRGGFIWDDDFYVTDNETLRSTAGLGRIWGELGAVPQYYPLVHTSFWIEYHLWGLNPAGYHLVNVLLHAISAILLWRLLAFLRVPGAWVAAAVFALHPVHVESVAWITERKNVLSGVLYLAAASVYLRSALAPGESASRSTQPRRYVTALLLFLGALLSKTVTGSLPAAILLVLWWKRGRIYLKDVYPLVPFFVLALGLGMLTATMEKHHVGAMGEEWNFSAVDRCLIAGRSLWFYASKLVLPWPLIFVYPRWIIDSHTWWQYLFPTAAVALVVGMWLARHRIGRGPLVALLFFGGTLTPALGFFNVYPMRFSFVADHFQYLASIGLIVLVVAVGVAMTGRMGTRGGRTLVACILLLLGVLTWRQGRMYAGLETLWQETIARNPSAWIAYNNLAPLLVQQGRLDEALAHCTKALQLKPDFTEAYNIRGNILVAKGEFEQGLQDYAAAMASNPRHVDAYYNRGIACYKMGRYDAAINDFTQAIALQPGHVAAYSNRAAAYEALGRLDEALQDYTKVIEFRPHFAPTYRSRGNAHKRKGLYDLAIGDYKKAIDLQPDDAAAYTGLCATYGALGRHDLAIREATRAIQLQPNVASGYANRAIAYYSVKEYESAWADVKRCRQLGGTPNAEFVKELAKVSGRTE